MIHQNEILRALVPFRIQDFVALNIEQLQSHSVYVALCIVILRAIGKADPREECSGFSKYALTQLERQVGFHDELCANTTMMLGMLAAANRALLGVQDLEANLRNTVDVDLLILRNHFWQHRWLSGFGFVSGSSIFSQRASTPSAHYEGSPVLRSPDRTVLANNFAVAGALWDATITPFAAGDLHLFRTAKCA